MDTILTSLYSMMNLTTIIALLIGGAFGIFVGALPGLSASMAVALLIPVTYFLDTVPALVLIISLIAMAIFAGDISGTYLRIPGTPASAAYADSTFLYTQQGKGELILFINLISSHFGTIIGLFFLTFFSPFLARIALRFSSYEYFWLASFGIFCSLIVAKGGLLKSLVSLLLGLFFASIGLDPVSGQVRLTGGFSQLVGGVGFIPMLIGLFAFSQVIAFLIPKKHIDDIQHIKKQDHFRIKDALAVVSKYKLKILRGGFIGVLIGALPGAGADIAAYVSFAMEKKAKKPTDTNLDSCIISATSSNNAAVAGAMIPALVFGIPGDSLSAIVIGILYMKGLRPGPTIFTEQTSEMITLLFAFIIANLLLLFYGRIAIKSFKNVLRIPMPILMPIVAVFCIVGAFAVENTIFSIFAMMSFGTIGYFLERYQYPLSPCILGFVLAPMLEESFLTSLMKSNGSLVPFFSRPIAGFLFFLLVTILVLQIFNKRSKRN